MAQFDEGKAFRKLLMGLKVDRATASLPQTTAETCTTKSMARRRLAINHCEVARRQCLKAASADRQL